MNKLYDPLISVRWDTGWIIWNWTTRKWDHVDDATRAALAKSKE
jgi:hypothetical protein